MLGERCSQQSAPAHRSSYGPEHYLRWEDQVVELVARKLETTEPADCAGDRATWYHA